MIDQTLKSAEINAEIISIAILTLTALIIVPKIEKLHICGRVINSHPAANEVFRFDLQFRLCGGDSEALP